MIIRVRRLLAVQRRLKDADPESATVTHLGRFAGDYRRQFGELLSVKLQQS